MQLGQKQADGATLREHLQRLEANTGRHDSRLDNALSEAAKPLWHLFAQLSARRGSGGFGPMPISPRDVQAWCEMRGLRLTPWELDTLDAMDDALLRAVAEQSPTEH